MPLSLVVLIAILVAAVATAAFALVTDRERRRVLSRMAAQPAAVLVIKRSRRSWTRRSAAWIHRRAPTTWSDRSDMTGRLVQAGFDDAAASSVYGSLSLASAVVVPVTALLLLPRGRPGLYVMGIVLALCIGLVAPRAVIDHVAQRRKERLRRALPDAMDLLVVCVEAGISLDAAIARVAKDMSTLHPELTHEFQILNRRINAGVTRDQALHGLWMRTGLDELRALASNMIQSERWGTSIATVLRVYAETLRRKRRQTAEKKAATAPLKMLFPLGVFIFPSIFVVIIGPALIKIYGMFHHLNQ